MLGRIRGYRPNHATVVAYLALFVALGGTSYAAVTLANNSVKSKHIANGNVKRSDIATNAVNSAKIAAGSLTSSDFAAGQIPPGPAGPAGPAGAKGTDGSDATINGVAAGGDLTGTYPNPVIGDAAVTGAKVANGTLHIGDIFTHAFTQSRNFVSVPAHGCTGSTVVSAFGSPGDIVLAFPPPDLGSPLIMPPTTFGTANELSLKICNIGDTPIDPPAQNYTVFVLTG